MSETHILIRLLWMYFPQNCEFGSALSKLQNFGRGGLNPPNFLPSVHHWFQMAPRLTFLIFSGFRKKEPNYTCLRDVKASH
jgi:hypothetical protein